MSTMHLCAIALHFEFAYNVTRIRNCGNRLCKFYALYPNHYAILLLISSKDSNELIVNWLFQQITKNISNRISFQVFSHL